MIATAYWERAKSQKSPEDYQKALDYFNEALKIARQQGSILRESSILSGIARTYESLNNYPQAIVNAKLGLELSRKHNIKSIKALNSLTTAYIGASADDLAIKSAQQLSQIILAPVADKLPGKRLVIVADGALQTIPFAALQTPPLTPPLLMEGGKERGRGGYQPLMLNHEIVNLPSASTIATQRQKLAGRFIGAKRTCYPR